jgi:hypothetical protein
MQQLGQLVIPEEKAVLSGTDAGLAAGAKLGRERKS